jgi:hypothetical protein
MARPTTIALLPNGSLACSNAWSRLAQTRYRGLLKRVVAVAQARMTPACGTRTTRGLTDTGDVARRGRVTVLRTVQWGTTFAATRPLVDGLGT